MVRSVQASDSRAALLVRTRTRILCSRRPEKGVMKLHRLRAFLPFPRACASICSRLFSLLRRFLAAKLRNSAKRCANPFTPDPSLKTGCATPRVKKRFFTRYLLASFLLRVSCLMALNPVDREVLNTAFGMSSAANEPLNPDAVRSKLGGINEDDFYVSLEIMEGDGLIETSRKLTRRPSNFWVTSRGVVKLLDENGQRPAIQAAVEKAIVAKPNSTLWEIAGAVAQSPLIVASIVETLENQGEIEVKRVFWAEIQVSGVHAALRRRVQEAGQ